MKPLREIPIADISTFKANLIRFLDKQDYACMLDSNDYTKDNYGEYLYFKIWENKFDYHALTFLYA